MCFPLWPHQGACATLSWAPLSQSQGATSFTSWRRWGRCPPFYGSGSSASSSGWFFRLVREKSEIAPRNRRALRVQAGLGVHRGPGVRPLRGGAVLYAVCCSHRAHQTGQPPGVEWVVLLLLLLLLHRTIKVPSGTKNGSSEWCHRRTIFGSTKNLSNQGSLKNHFQNSSSNNL